MKYFFTAQWANVHRLKTVFASAVLLSFYLLLFYGNNSNGEEQLQIRSGQVRMDLPKCKCSKYVNYNPDSGNTQNNGPRNGTCSKESWIRGPGQKVVGFTYYEPIKEEKSTEDKHNREYFKGIAENVKLVKDLYGEDWTVRLYYRVQDDNSPMLSQICDLACSQPTLDICDANFNPRLGNATILYPLIWRFLPVIDLQVDFYLSRDLDSRVSQREVSAVAEFLKSDKDIHVMRDHPAHSAFMMGGTWGAKVLNQRKELMQAFKKMFKDGVAYIGPEKGGGYDQIALTRYVWPWGKKVALSHDAYTCRKFSNTSPFPTKRLAGVGNFIGSVISLNSSIGMDDNGICPEKCRPKDHKDWTHC